jgi:hypothetical protein
MRTRQEISNGPGRPFGESQRWPGQRTENPSGSGPCGVSVEAYHHQGMEAASSSCSGSIYEMTSMLFPTGYRCPLDSASERKLLLHEPLTTMDPRYSSPNAVATGGEETRHWRFGPVRPRASTGDSTSSSG